MYPSRVHSEKNYLISAVLKLTKSLVGFGYFKTETDVQNVWFLNQNFVAY